MQWSHIANERSCAAALTSQQARQLLAEDSHLDLLLAVIELVEIDVDGEIFEVVHDLFEIVPR